MNKNQFRLLVLLSILLCVTNSFFSDRLMRYHYPVKNLNEGWMIYKNDEMVSGTVALNVRTYFHGDNHRGDIIFMERELEDLGDIRFPSVYICNGFTAMEVFLDGEPYKEYDLHNAAAGRYVGWNNHLITLPDDYKGRTLGIKLYVTEEHAMDVVRNIKFGNARDLEHWFVHTYLNPMMLGACLCMLGAILCVISIVFSVVMKRKMINAITNVLCVMLGMITMSYHGIPFLYMDASSCTFLFYALIMVCVGLSYLYVRMLYPPENKKLYLASEIVTWVYSVIRILLHFLQVLSIHEYFDLFLLLVAVCVYHVYRNYRKCREDGNITFTRKLEFVAFVSCSGLMSIFWLSVRLTALGILPDNALLRQIRLILLCLGPMVFLFLQCIDFLWSVSELYSRRVENEDLIRVAYEDVLTKLPNRAQMDRKVRELEEDLADYCVISMDLNDLKKVNDTYGHAQGDELIRTFGSALKAVFAGRGFCCRLGGDEFVAILEGEHIEDADQLIKELKKKMEESNQMSNSPWKCSCACGYAFRQEGKEWHRTYLLADQRMYKSKKEGKENGDFS
ncbi:MAG: GGDEF domain-containing protein [Lachnospiraceae bacterium]|nr:GGDEF domain-containing protein [Lachnospiraceae bacterium]